jgi:YD repeat-containing protein
MRLAVGPNGELFVVEVRGGHGGGYASFVRMVDSAGRYWTVAGGGGVPYATYPRLDSLQLALRFARGIALDPEGDLYIADEGFDHPAVTQIQGGWVDTYRNPGLDNRNRVIRVRRRAPSYAEDRYVVPSDDGRVVYVFDPNGQHLRTYDAERFAGDPDAPGFVYELGYDAVGRLASVVDADGQTTTVAYDVAEGHERVILRAPFGQTTRLTLNDLGYAERIEWLADDGATAQAVAATTMRYSSDGLLRERVLPAGLEASDGERAALTKVFDYDGEGRLVLDAGPGRRRKELQREESDDRRATTVTFTTGGGRAATYTLIRQPNGSMERIEGQTTGDGTVLGRLDFFDVGTPENDPPFLPQSWRVGPRLADPDDASYEPGDDPQNLVETSFLHLEPPEGGAGARRIVRRRVTTGGHALELLVDTLDCRQGAASPDPACQQAGPEERFARTTWTLCPDGGPCTAATWTLERGFDEIDGDTLTLRTPTHPATQASRTTELLLDAAGERVVEIRTTGREPLHFAYGAAGGPSQGRLTGLWFGTDPANPLRVTEFGYRGGDEYPPPPPEPPPEPSMTDGMRAVTIDPLGGSVRSEYDDAQRLLTLSGPDEQWSAALR